MVQSLRRFGTRSALVVVDGLHHVCPNDDDPRPAWDDPAQLEAVGARLKHLAISMGLPVLASVGAEAAAIPLLHSADTILRLTTDEDLLVAGGLKEAGSSRSKKHTALKELLDRIKKENPLEFSHSEYAMVRPDKHRAGPLSPVVFVFHKAWHQFEEL